jgi:hypothetical protein
MMMRIINLNQLKRGITMLINEGTKKSRIAVRDTKHKYRFDTHILPRKVGGVHA